MREPRPKKTVEDYLALPEDHRVELLDGEFFVSPSPSLRHQRILGRLFLHLTAFVESRGIGGVVLSPFDCVLSRENVVQPDLLFVRGDRLDRNPLRLDGAPDLAVEILSTGKAQRDRNEKSELYSRYGLPELWIVDPDANTVEVVRLETGTFRLVGTFDGKEKILSPTFPRLDLRASQIFE